MYWYTADTNARYVILDMIHSSRRHCAPEEHKSNATNLHGAMHNTTNGRL